MATVRLRLGPADHGRRVSLETADAAEYVPGFKYEIIDGRLYVSPTPNPSENRLETWLYGALFLYSHDHRRVVNYVSTKPRVFIPARKRVAAPGTAGCGHDGVAAATPPGEPDRAAASRSKYARIHST